MVKVTEKVKVFLESVTKTVFYVTCTPLNSNVESLTLPLELICKPGAFDSAREKLNSMLFLERAITILHVIL